MCDRMIPPALRRVLAAAALAVYALASLVLLPAHRLEGPAAPSGPAGAFYAATCPDRDCHDPAHRHSEGHSHDPATCVSCVQGRAAESAAPSGPSLAGAGALRGAAPSARPAASRSAPRGLHPARGPPVLLS